MKLIKLIGMCMLIVLLSTSVFATWVDWDGAGSSFDWFDYTETFVADGYATSSEYDGDIDIIDDNLAIDDNEFTYASINPGSSVSFIEADDNDCEESDDGDDANVFYGFKGQFNPYNTFSNNWKQYSSANEWRVKVVVDNDNSGSKATEYFTMSSACRAYSMPVIYMAWGLDAEYECTSEGDTADIRNEDAGFIIGCAEGEDVTGIIDWIDDNENEVSRSAFDGADASTNAIIENPSWEPMGTDGFIDSDFVPGHSTSSGDTIYIDKTYRIYEVSFEANTVCASGVCCDDQLYLGDESAHGTTYYCDANVLKTTAQVCTVNNNNENGQTVITTIDTCTVNEICDATAQACVPDNITPEFTTIPANLSIELNVDTISADFDATDNSGTVFYGVNNSDFSISGTGVLTNNTHIPIGTYNLNVTINDTAGNVNATLFQIVVDDTIAPVCSLDSISEGTNPEYQYVSGSTIYYNNGQSGDFDVTITTSDVGGIDYVEFPLTVSAASNDSSSPYSKTYTWDNSDTFSSSANAICYDTGANSDSVAFTVTADSDDPTGSILYLNETKTSLSTTTDLTATDAISGIVQLYTLEQRTATFSNNSCDSFGSWGSVTESASSYIYFAPTYSGSSTITLVDGTCYQFRYTVTDNVGNQVTFTSGNVTRTDVTNPSVSGPVISTGLTTYSNFIKGNSGLVYSTVSDSASGIDTSTCEYSINNGGAYASGTFSGGQCQLTSLDIADSSTYTFKFRIDDNAGLSTTSSSSTTYTGDETAPSTTDDFDNTWRNTNFTGSLSPIDSLSGVANTTYCVGAIDCTPTISGNTPTAGCADDSVCSSQYVRYFSTDNIGNVESTQTSAEIRIDKEDPSTAIAYSSTSTPRESNVNFTLTCDDSSGSGCSTTGYKVVGSGTTCTASGLTTGTTGDIECAVNSTCSLKVCYRSIDVASNEESINTGQTFLIDKSGPTILEPVLSTGFTIDGSYIKVDSGLVYATVFDDIGVNTSTCEYTTNGGSSWSAGTYSTGQCQLTGFDGTDGQNYTFGFRVNDTNGNQQTSDFIGPYTVDETAPSSTDNTNTNWRITNFDAVITPTDSGSGVASTFYCVDESDSCTPTTSGTEVTISCAPGSICTQYLRYYSVDALGNTESVQSSQVRIDKEDPTTSDDATSVWTANNVTVTLTPLDSTGSGVNRTEYCVDTSGTCTPSTIGTSVSVTCTDGNDCLQYVRYRTYDNAGNVESIQTSDVIRIDQKDPIVSTVTLNNFFIYNNQYIKSTSGTIYAVVTDSGAGLDTNSCQYELNGVWSDATYNAGLGRCEITGINVADSTNYTFNIRVNDTLGNLDEGTQIGTYTGDETAPSTTDDGNNSWQSINQVITFSPTDALSGVDDTFYCVDSSNTCVPSTSGTSVTLIGPSDSLYQRYVRYYSIDNLDNQESTQLTGLIKIDKQKPVTTATGVNADASPYTFGSATISDSVNVSLACSDGSGSGCSGTTLYCTDTDNTCTPALSYSSPIEITDSGTTYVRYYSIDNVSNTETTKSSEVIVNANVATVAEIYPTTAFITDTVYGNCTGTDDDGDDMRYFWRWYINGELNQSDNDITDYPEGVEQQLDSLNQSDFDIGDTIIFSCRATDGFESSPWSNSTEITIFSNFDGSYDSIAVDPSSPAAWVDGQEYTFEIVWSSGNVLDATNLTFDGVTYEMTKNDDTNFTYILSDLNPGTYEYYFTGDNGFGTVNSTANFTYFINSPATLNFDLYNNLDDPLIDLEDLRGEIDDSLYFNIYNITDSEGDNQNVDITINIFDGDSSNIFTASYTNQSNTSNFNTSTFKLQSYATHTYVINTTDVNGSVKSYTGNLIATNIDPVIQDILTYKEGQNTACARDKSCVLEIEIFEDGCNLDLEDETLTVTEAGNIVRLLDTSWTFKSESSKNLCVFESNEFYPATVGPHTANATWIDNQSSNYTYIEILDIVTITVPDGTGGATTNQTTGGGGGGGGGGADFVYDPGITDPIEFSVSPQADYTYIGSGQTQILEFDVTLLGNDATNFTVEIDETSASEWMYFEDAVGNKLKQITFTIDPTGEIPEKTFFVKYKLNIPSGASEGDYFGRIYVYTDQLTKEYLVDIEVGQNFWYELYALLDTELFAYQDEICNDIFAIAEPVEDSTQEITCESPKRIDLRFTIGGLLLALVIGIIGTLLVVNFIINRGNKKNNEN